MKYTMNSIWDLKKLNEESEDWIEFHAGDTKGDGQLYLAVMLSGRYDLQCLSWTPINEDSFPLEIVVGERTYINTANSFYFGSWNDLEDLRSWLQDHEHALSVHSTGGTLWRFEACDFHSVDPVSFNFDQPGFMFIYENGAITID